LAFRQKFDLVVAADEIGQTRQVDRLEAALGIGYALDRPRCDRLGNTLNLVPAEVTQMNRSPSSRRVEAATTIVPGSANA
jgi:hypothetical protein